VDFVKDEKQRVSKIVIHIGDETLEAKKIS